MRKGLGDEAEGGGECFLYFKINILAYECFKVAYKN